LSSPVIEAGFVGLKPSSYIARLALPVLFCAAVFLITPWVGSTGVSWSNVLAGINPDREIFVLARVPRILFGAVAGGALAVAGVVFQAMLRNALATPFTLGVSSGSSFGAVLAIWLGFDIVLLGVPLVSLAAFGGALLAISLVFAIARSRGALPTFTLLLAGVTLNFVFSALILFIHYAAADFTESFLMIRWMMGGLTNVSYDLILKTAPFVLAAVTVLLWYAADLNALAAGEDWARTHGVDVGRLKTTCFVVASLLTGVITAVAGPIGFIGLIVPHSLRLVVGPDHRILVPSAFFGGAGFLVLCDTAARTVFAPSEMPVGVLTALLGGPFFIFLLKKRKGDLF